MKNSKRTLIVFCIIAVLFIVMFVWNLMDGSLPPARAALFIGLFLVWTAYTFMRYFNYRKEEEQKEQKPKK